LSDTRRCRHAAAGQRLNRRFFGPLFLRLALDLLNDLKAGGYKIGFMQPKYSVTTIASYDEAILKQLKGPMTDTRPTSSVVRTISE
jgi:hypothetical protein